MRVEMYVGWPDQTWGIMVVGVDNDTPAHLISEAAVTEAECVLNRIGKVCAFVGVYHIDASDVVIEDMREWNMAAD